METIKLAPAIIAFVKVSQRLSFSKAANDLGVSKSYISKLVQDFETNLGVQLFIRSTRKVLLTSLGEHYFKLYQDHIAQIESISSQLKSSSNLPSGNIRITLAGAFGEDVISPLISRLQGHHPSINTELLFREEILNLEEENIDLAIRVSQNKPKDGNAVKIGERKEFVCASASFFRRNGRPIKPKDLQKYNCLTSNNNIWSFKSRNKTTKVEVSGNFKTSNGRGLCQAALSGLGIIKLPEVYLSNHLAERKLIPVLENYTATPVSLWAVTPHKKKNPPFVELAIKELQKSVFPVI